MPALGKELVILILQFLYEEKHTETVHKLEQESGLYFNIGYFSELVKNGEWDAVEKYLSGFTKFNDNRYSMKMFFEIRKQNYLEALDGKEFAKAVEILKRDLKVFAMFHVELYNDLTQLLALEDFRENDRLTDYGDTNHARAVMLKELIRLIQVNPLFKGKLQFPTVRKDRLRTLINQSLNWQHKLCKNPKPSPEIQTLFTDHSCLEPRADMSPSSSTDDLTGGVSRVAKLPHTATPALFRPKPTQLPASRCGWMANLSPVPHPSATVGHTSVVASPNNPDSSAMLKHPMTPNNPVRENQTDDPGRVLKRPRVHGASGEGSRTTVNIVPGGYSGQSHTHVHYSTSTDDLPNKVMMMLNQGSSVESMDFHPVQPILLLVGTSTGDMAIWNIVTRKKLALRKFKVWDLGTSSVALKASLAADNTISTNRVKWSPEGLFLGVAFSKNIVQIYNYNYQSEELINHLEIEAHSGSVNDIAFAYPKNKMSFITCGDDKVIKVWDALTGATLFSFEGHEAPVYSVCPHEKETIQFLFSVSTDGKIKAWLYDNLGSRVDYDAPGCSSSRMVYSTDGRRLFTCGTNKEGESHLVEWNESEGVVKHAYRGFGKRSVGVVQFDTAKNRFLAVGDESVIKFWDMDQVDVLTTTDAEGGLPASPCLTFSEEGKLLAVSTDDNGIKILANGDGLRLLHAIEYRLVDSSNAAAAAAKALTPNVGSYGGSTGTGEHVAPVVAIVNMISENCSMNRRRLTDEPGDGSRVWKLAVVNEPSECRSQRLPDNVANMRILRLIYTNAGVAILALASNGVHKLWKWPENEGNPNGRATTSVVPHLLQPPSGITMVNELRARNPEDAVSCFALSNNDSYVMSASGGKISLYNLPRFKTMTKIMAPPPAATYLAFHPEDNNIIAIGMDDSSIHIYNIRISEVKAKLYGHHKRISGLAFSTTLMLLVSAGADSQLQVWSTDGWENNESKHLRMPPGRVASPLADTRVQFHEDQTNVLVVHETQIAIYSAAKLECLKQWVPPGARGSITHATYSCDSEYIYASFEDGSVGVLTSSTLRLRCQINPNSYLPDNPKAYPVVIAAHPAEPSQFALGLTDGGVVVLEPNASDGQWGTSPPTENGGARYSSSQSMAGSSDQQ